MTSQWKEVFRQQRDKGDILWRIILWTAEGVSFRSEGPTTAKERWMG